MVEAGLPGSVSGERVFVGVISATHGMQHFFGRVFPPLIPLLALDLQVPLWKLGAVVTVWSLANGLTQAPWGQLSDRFDRRFILPTGVLLVGAGYSVVAASTVLGPAVPTLSLFEQQFSGSLVVVSLGMIVAGVGRAATHPTGYPLLTANVDSDNTGVALGRWGSASKLGDAAGPAFVGGALLVLSWEAVFVAIAGIAVVYAVGLFGYMTHSAIETDPEADGDEAAEADGYWVLILLVLVAFIAGSFASRGVGTYLPAFVTDVYGFSFTVGSITFEPASVASMYFSVVLLSGAAMMAVVGDLIDRYDPAAIMFVLYLAAAVVLAGLAVIPLTPATLLVAAIMVGGTLYAINPARDEIVSRLAPGDRQGRIFGYYWTAFLVTTAAFPTLIGYMSDVFGFRQTYLILAVGPILALVPVVALIRSDRY